MSRNRVFPKTSQYLPQQFPEFYRDEGPNFIAFVQEFYRWKDEISNRNKSRRLLDYGDVDETEESYLSHFINKYMWSLPRTMVEPRFLEKHILDVYRSKGSVEGLRLLFRMLYDKEATVYVPSKDMLAPSAGVFFRARYIELTPNPFNASLVQSRIYAWESKATALAESYVEMFVRGRPVYVLFISNVVGNFQIGDHIYSDGMSPTNAPSIVGSMTRFKQNKVIPDASVGDKYNDVSGYGALRVSEISSIAGGTIDFNIIEGGHGYTYNAKIYVVSGALITQGGDFLMTEADEMLDILATGIGAEFSISNIDNLETLGVDVSIIAPYENDLLTDSTILYNESLITDDLFAILEESGEVLITEGSGSTINDDVIIWEWESVVDIVVGTIALVSVESPGLGYVDNATVVVIDPFISLLGVFDIDGNRYGEDAIIEGAVAPSKDAAKDYSVENSGYGYYEGELVSLKYGNDEFLGDDAGGVFITEDYHKICWGEDDSETVTGFAVLGAIGKQNGYWLDNDGMLNSNKVIQDSYYYQEYSYDINTELPIDTYEKAIKNVYHPAGVELFGTAAAYLDNEARSTGTGGIVQYGVGEAGGVGSGDAVGTRVMPADGLAEPGIDNFVDGVGEFDGGVPDTPMMARIFSASIDLDEIYPPPTYTEDPFVVIDFVNGIYSINGVSQAAGDMVDNTSPILPGTGAYFKAGLDVDTSTAMPMFMSANVLDAINAANGRFIAVAEYGHVESASNTIPSAPFHLEGVDLGSGPIDVMTLYVEGRYNNTRYYYSSNDVNWGVSLGGTDFFTEGNIFGSAPDTYGIQKAVLRYDLDQGPAMAVNGGAVAANSDPMPYVPNWTEGRIGGYGTLGGAVLGPMRGVVRSLKFYPTKDNDEMWGMSERTPYQAHSPWDMKYTYPMVFEYYDQENPPIIHLDFINQDYFLGKTRFGLDQLLDRTDFVIDGNGAKIVSGEPLINLSELAKQVMNDFAYNEYMITLEWQVTASGNAVPISMLSVDNDWKLVHTPTEIHSIGNFIDGPPWDLVLYTMRDEFTPRRAVASFDWGGGPPTYNTALEADSAYASNYGGGAGRFLSNTIYNSAVSFGDVSLGGIIDDGANATMDGYIRKLSILKRSANYIIARGDFIPPIPEEFDIGDSVLYFNFMQKQYFVNGQYTSLDDLMPNSIENGERILPFGEPVIQYVGNITGTGFAIGVGGYGPFIKFSQLALDTINALNGRFTLVIEFTSAAYNTGETGTLFQAIDGTGNELAIRMSDVSGPLELHVNYPYQEGSSSFLTDHIFNINLSHKIAVRYDVTGANTNASIINGDPDELHDDSASGMTPLAAPPVFTRVLFGGNDDTPGFYSPSGDIYAEIRSIAIYPIKDDTEIVDISVRDHPIP